VSLILPVVAPFGTTAVTFTLVTNANAAAVPLNVTEFTPVKFVPWIVTVVPTLPFTGLKLEIVGPVPVTLKLAPLVAVPDGVVSVICPVVAPVGTTAVTFTLVTNVKLADLPLNLTEFTPVKSVPWIVTVVTLKLLPLVAVSVDVDTEIGPSVAPAGTSAVICVPAMFVVNGVLTPLKNRTWVTAEKLLPLIVTWVPTGPLEGLNPEMLGEPPAAAGNAVIATTSATSTADAPIRVDTLVAIDARFIVILPWTRQVTPS
jgi:hypothetical protein